MKHLALIGIWTFCLAAAVGCAPQESPPRTDPTATPPTVGLPNPTYDNLTTQAAGFTAGQATSATTVFVLFDPQCPHCGQLWKASIALHNKAKWVWIPVAIMNDKSAPQGAALLASATPLQLMNEHEDSIVKGGGGIASPLSATQQGLAAIKTNTQLFKSTGVDSVPFIIVKTRGKDVVITRKGALDTSGLEALLGKDNSL